MRDFGEKKHKFKCPKKQALHGDSFCRRPGRTIVVGAVVAVKVVVELYHCATGRTNIGTLIIACGASLLEL